VPTNGDKSFRAFVQIVAFLTLPALAKPQQSARNGIVNVARMPIYKEPGRSGGIETVLNKGDRIYIVGEIMVGDERWCNVVVRDQNQPPGYAPCSDLQSTPITSMQSINSGTHAPATSQPPIRATPPKTNVHRVFITDSQSWAAIGSFSVANGNGGGGMAGGSSPQTVEVIDDFAKHCASVIVTNDKSNADYIVLFDRDAAAKSKTVLSRADKIAVFKKNGDLVYSGKTRSVANTVKGACAALAK
jgi:hypothetical protein